jgi:hypothetical protein
MHATLPFVSTSGPLARCANTSREEVATRSSSLSSKRADRVSVPRRSHPCPERERAVIGIAER